MSIVSSPYTIDSDWHVVERHIDHLGQQYMQTWFAPSAWTTQQIEAMVAEHAARIEESLAKGEIDEVLQ